VETQLLRQLRIYTTPVCLVVLSVTALTMAQSYSGRSLNHFDVYAIVCMFSGGFGGLAILIWNLLLQNRVEGSPKRSDLTVISAVFGLIFLLAYVLLIAFEMVNRSDSDSFLKNEFQFYSIVQLFLIVAWESPLLVKSVRIVSGRFNSKAK
jgi:nitrate reductase gamma subunit